MLLVLEPANASWKAGVQAVVAELLTTGYELRVRAASAGSSAELEQELKQQIVDSGAMAGISITRQASQGTALLCRRSASQCESLSVEVSDAELSRSRLALAVVQRLRPVDLSVSPPPSPPARPKRDAPAPPRLDRARPETVRPVHTWLSGGVVVSSGTSAPTPWLSATVGLTIAKPWGVELGFAGSPLPGRTETRAGSLSLRAFQGLGFATFEPFAKRRGGFGLGLGGGVVRLQSTAAPAPGFEGYSRGVTVGVVSARTRLFWRFGPLQAGLTIDPGMLVPAVRIEAGTETVLRIGRPWVAMQAGLGMEL